MINVQDMHRCTAADSSVLLDLSRAAHRQTDTGGSTWGIHKRTNADYLELSSVYTRYYKRISLYCRELKELREDITIKKLRQCHAKTGGATRTDRLHTADRFVCGRECMRDIARDHKYH